MNEYNDNSEKCYLCKLTINFEFFKFKECNDCHRFLCTECIESSKNNHFLCVECNTEICCYKKICENCDIHPYHMITDNIAVGSCVSKYENFDIIVNLNYPENGAPEDDIEMKKSKGKLIINLGILDNERKEKVYLKFLNELIPVLYKYYNNKKILFHCFAGMSRSAGFAIGYLSYSQNINIEDAHKLVKDKRKFIEINNGLKKALTLFFNK